jgi:hypothetical protein
LAELWGDLAALLIVGALGYNCFIRVRNIIKDYHNDKKRLSKRGD